MLYQNYIGGGLTSRNKELSLSLWELNVWGARRKLNLNLPGGRLADGVIHLEYRRGHAQMYQLLLKIEQKKLKGLMCLKKNSRRAVLATCARLSGETLFPSLAPFFRLNLFPRAFYNILCLFSNCPG